MEDDKLIPHLFRNEYRKIVSVLYKRFGFDQRETAEDIASDTFLSAAQTWPLHGVPENPVAWLHVVARNKAKNHLARQQTFNQNVARELSENTRVRHDDEIDFSPENIKDSQLQMMFAICHPSISFEAQIGLSLRILCGFGIDEIADAFLTNKETINKRLFRAREKLRDENIPIEFPGPEEIDLRLGPVLATIYLLFSEGYYSTTQNQTIRKELCMEAMRLCNMLVGNKSTNKPQVNALLSLMCFQASRIDARVGANGELILYDDQDPTLWNEDLISKGGYFLHEASTGKYVSRYHLEAAIAYWYTRKADTKEKWENILQLYNRLLQLQYSPIAALNRTYALAKVKGKHQAIEEATKLQLSDNHFYFMLLGELYTGIDNQKAKVCFQRALELARTSADRQTIQKRIGELDSNP